MNGDDSMTAYQILSLWGMWLGSLGTCAAVVYALYGAAMRRWFNKPSLVLEISDVFPFCSRIRKDDASESNSDLDVVEICASLINKNQYCAQRSRVTCTGIYVQNANGTTFCPFISFRPKQFQWLDLPPERMNYELDIWQNVEHFVKIAEISKSLNKMAVNSPSMRNGVRTDSFDPASVTIAIPNPHKPGANYVRIPFDHKSVLLTLAISCSGCTPTPYNIRIDWKGERVDEYDQPGKLSVSLISEQDVARLITPTSKRR